VGTVLVGMISGRSGLQKGFLRQLQERLARFEIKGSSFKDYLALHILQPSKFFLGILFRSCVASYPWERSSKLMLVKQGIQRSQSHGLLDILTLRHHGRRPEQFAGTYLQFP
jgi:hypothetical protein